MTDVEQIFKWSTVMIHLLSIELKFPTEKKWFSFRVMIHDPSTFNITILHRTDSSRGEMVPGCVWLLIILWYFQTKTNILNGSRGLNIPVQTYPQPARYSGTQISGLGGRGAGLDYCVHNG